MPKRKTNKISVLEKRHHALAPKKVYYKRLLVSFGFASCFLLLSLFIGITGYHFIAGLNWVDSFLNASMILGGMGPVDTITNNSGKIFASFYAIYSGVSFLTAFSILIAPAYHRLIHKFHLSDDNEE